MKRFDKKLQIRISKKDFERIKAVAAYGISEFMREFALKEVDRIEKKKIHSRIEE